MLGTLVLNNACIGTLVGGNVIIRNVERVGTIVGGISLFCVGALENIPQVKGIKVGDDIGFNDGNNVGLGDGTTDGFCDGLGDGTTDGFCDGLRDGIGDCFERFLSGLNKGFLVLTIAVGL